MAATLNLKIVAVKCVRHAAFDAAFEALHNNVGSIASRAKLAKCEPGGFAGDILFMNVFNPWKIGQVTFAASEQEAHGQSGWAFQQVATLMHIASPIRPPRVLDEFEHAGVYRGESVANRAAQPARERRNGDPHRGGSRIAIVV